MSERQKFTITRPAVVTGYDRQFHDIEMEEQIERAATMSAAKIREAASKARQKEIERTKMLDAQA